MTITGTRVARVRRLWVVEVDCRGPRGGPQEWTVQFSRLGALLGAVQTSPLYSYHPGGRTAPEAVLEAARGTLAAHRNT